MWKLKAFCKDLNEKERETVCFAVSELRKYLSMCTDEPVIAGETELKEEGTLILGVNLSGDINPVKDLRYDDSILIDVKGKCGIITGVNARSVLIAAYRYLRELGYVFVRPGKNGEKLPEKFEVKDVYVKETPDFRYRMICIEGSVTYESVVDMIDWIPKVGMSGYYTQFFIPYIFFKRWYAHKGYEFENPLLKGDTLTPDDVASMVKLYEKEIAKRDLIYQKVGHGWTCDPFGMTSYGWEPVDPATIPKGIEKYLALVDGKREIPTTGNYAYVPMVVQLCYGNPEVRKILVDHFIDYCKKNPHIDIVTFGWGDSANEQCECELCRDTLPSDFAVLMINEICRGLKEAGLPTRIRTGMYGDTFWKPEKYVYEDIDRILFSLAPAARSYSRPFPKNSDYKLPPFVRNKNDINQTTEDVVACFFDWRTVATGDAGIFDYYYMWDCYMDLGCTDRTRVIMEDIKTYDALGVSGLTSCQGQRVFCPTSLGMNVMARTLWNKESDFDEVRDGVLRDEYGKDFALVRDYLQDLSTYGLPEVVRIEKPFEEANIPSYEKGIARINDFMPVIEAHLGCENNVEALSWSMLKFHSELSKLLLEAFIKISRGAEPEEVWPPIEDYVNRNEWEYREYFDAFEFKYSYQRLVFPRIKSKKQQGTIGM